jgi:OOP family OmpA-OmpF porin
VNDLVLDESADRPTGLITVADSILFDVDSADLESGSEVIEDLALLFTARSDWVMTITGHTDSAGDDVYNLELSLARASAVRDALVELGVEAERLRTVGAGSTSPVASNDTENGRQLNRRIEFRVDRN